MKKKQLCLLLFIITLSVQAGPPKLKFKNNLFKIVQFTDIHWNQKDQYKTTNDSTEILMRRIIETEKPDLVIITGDVAVSLGALEGWKQATRPMRDLHVPFAITFGNHDTETDMTKKQILEYIQESPYNVTGNAGKEIDGVGNCVLPIKSSKGNSDAWLLYLFDSHAYANDTLIGGYDWVKKSQIDWYVNQSNKYIAKNGKTLPAFAFFHIPLPEYNYVRNKKTTIGNNTENVCSPIINSGLFFAFMQQKDVMATFVGHDHNNDFIGSLANIYLAYGRKTGLVPAYEEILEKGARVIELQEKEKEVRTYIRTLTGTSLKCTFKK